LNEKHDEAGKHEQAGQSAPRPRDGSILRSGGRTFLYGHRNALSILLQKPDLFDAERRPLQVGLARSDGLGEGNGNKDKGR